MEIAPRDKFVKLIDIDTIYRGGGSLVWRDVLRCALPAGQGKFQLQCGHSTIRATFARPSIVMRAYTMRNSEPPKLISPDLAQA